MRNLLALAAALVLIFLGLGWYLNWYHISTTTTSDGHREISIDLDPTKIRNDISKEVNKVFGSKDTATTPPATTPAKTTPGTTTGFQRDGSWVYPETVTPVPPGGGPTLPPPR